MKAVCILLSVISMTAAFSIGFQLVNALWNFDENLVFSDRLSEAEIKDCHMVSHQMMHDVMYAYGSAIGESDPEGRYEYTPLVSQDATFGVYKKGKLVFGEDIREKALSSEYGFAVVGGKVKYTYKLDGGLDYFTEDGSFLVNDYQKAYDTYVLYQQENKMYDASLIDNYQRFEQCRQIKVYRNGVITVLLVLLSLGLAVYACVVCGRREKGKIKLAFIDYVPVDIHLLLSGGLIAGAVVLISNLGLLYFENNASSYCTAIRFASSALAAAIWTVFLEFMTSFIRVCKSERKFYDCCLGLFLIKILIVKPFKALFKALFTYKPNYIKHLVIRTLIGYFLFVLADGVITFLLGYNYQEFVLVGFGVLLAVTAVFVVFAVRYMVYLDKLITAAHNRTVPDVDYNRLPNSLKVLASSLQYTRRELNAAVDRAVKDERMRTELITNVSHDLRTPLTSIITYVDLLKQCEVEDENAREYIEVLDDKGKRLKRLIDDLIEASKITSGVIRLNPVMLSLNELAAQAVYERQQEFVDNNLELVFKGDKTPVSCFADGNKTFRILDNLLSNARKYSARGTRVYCDVYETDNFSVFEIKNISAQQLDISPQELTERFVRGDRSRNAEGNGLGLSIADNLCRAQGGKLVLSIDGDLFKAQVLLPKHN